MYALGSNIRKYLHNSNQAIKLFSDLGNNLFMFSKTLNKFGQTQAVFSSQENATLATFCNFKKCNYSIFLVKSPAILFFLLKG
jgi:hypothetical protein